MLTQKLESSHRQILIYFKSFLADATNMKLIEENPMENVYIPSRNDISKSKMIPGEEDVFFSNYYSIEEIMNFLAASKNYCTEKQHIFFLVLAHSGIRRGEAMALTWNDIDFQKRLIHVNKAAAYSTEKKLHIKDTKNYMHRKVRIDSETLGELQKWKASQERLLKMKNQYVKNNREQYIFQNRDNNLTDPAQAGRWLSQLYECCDLRRITVHGLRHTHCTLGLKSRQYTIEEMMHRLGHKDIKVTMDVYTHVTVESMETNPDLYMEYLQKEYENSK
ncbi:site-specific integrase [Lysinibacillus sp. HST-98]|uniref:site-specific integrase n=1 Tax=Lysinibacillus sp. HST-98 TaxID=2800419 RepID=UPI001927DFAA|nr:site-specific integrase [Lysinibacillus sp. HST-98]MBL3731665.1 site-specific integrase [Lysinibacillus sp. HST-98]